MLTIAQRRLDPGLRAAIEAAGGIGKLAALVGLTRTAVSRWRKVPVEHVAAVSKGTKLTREAIRPDVYYDIDEENC